MERKEFNFRSFSPHLTLFKWFPFILMGACFLVEEIYIFHMKGNEEIKKRRRNRFFRSLSTFPFELKKQNYFSQFPSFHHLCVNLCLNQFPTFKRMNFLFFIFTEGERGSWMIYKCSSFLFIVLHVCKKCINVQITWVSTCSFNLLSLTLI